MSSINSCSPYTNTYVDNKYLLSQIQRLNARVCSLESKINQNSTSSIEAERIEFIVGDPDDGMMNEGDNMIVITDSNIIVDSVEVVVNGTPVTRKHDFPLYYTPIYGVNQIGITFNIGLFNDNLVKITYLKKIP